MHRSKTVLRAEVIDQIKVIGHADILVGIPSFRNSKTIRHVVETVGEGLSRHFPQLRAVIVNSDGGSDDNTREIARAANVAPDIARVVIEYQGLPGKGSAFRTIFEVADRLAAKTCIVVDSDLRSITPDWIKLLGEPVHLHNFGFVAPLYTRHKFDGTITNSIAYPLMCALYGHSLRQPIGGEFALSGSLAKILAQQDVWETDVARFGIDIWMTTTAVCEGFSLCQANMGVKLHDERNPGEDLGPMFRQVVGTIFSLMSKYQSKWQSIDGCRLVELCGTHAKGEADPVGVDLNSLVDKFAVGFAEYEPVLADIVSLDSFARLKQLAVNIGQEELVFPDSLWARIVYDHAVAYNFRADIEAENLLGSLMAVFLGRTAAYVSVALAMSEVEAEHRVQEAAAAFGAEKPYLAERWGATTVVASQN